MIYSPYSIIVPYLYILMRALLLCVLCVLVSSEEWYMRDSHLISDQQFFPLMQRDTFKIVKYFLPHCKYCRLLKQVFDQLKRQNTFHFDMYDLNCQWYPSFCAGQGVPGSFPFVIIYNQRGDQYQTIHGFYPAPVIMSILDNVERQIHNIKGLQKETKENLNGVIQQYNMEIILMDAIPNHQSIVLEPIKQQTTQHNRIERNIYSIAQEPVKSKQSTTQHSDKIEIEVNKQLEQMNRIEHLNEKLQQQLKIKDEQLLINLQSSNKVENAPPVMKIIFNSCCLILSILYVCSLYFKKKESDDALKEEGVR